MLENSRQDIFEVLDEAIINLQRENESNTSPGWIHEVNLLEKDAERCMQRAELDELDYSIYVVDDIELKPNEARLEDEMGALSVGDSNDMGEGDFEVHAIEDSDDEDIEEDMPQIEGLFTHRPHHREEVSIAEEHHTPQAFERNDMEVESDYSDSEFQMAQDDMSSSEDSKAEVGIRDQPLTGFFPRSKSLPDVKQR